MADYNHDVKIQIEALLKDIGLTDAKRRLDDVATSTQKASKEFKAAEVSASSFGQALVGALAAGAVTAFVKSSVVEFAKFDRALTITTMRLRQMGLDAEQVTPKIREMLQEIQDSGGPVITDTLPAFNRFIGITKDVEAALAATSLAADIAEAKQIDLGQAAQSVAAILQGRYKQAATQLDIELVKLNGDAKTAAEIMEEVQRQYAGTAKATDDTQDSVDKLSNTWADFKLKIGEMFAPLLGAVNGILNLGKAIDTVRNSILGSSSAREDLAKWIKSLRVALNLDTADLPDKLSGLSKLTEQAGRAGAGWIKEDEENALFDLMEAESKKNAAELKPADKIRKKAEKDHAAEMREYEDRTRAELAWQDEQSKWYEDQDRELEKAVANWDEYYQMRSDLSEGFEKRELERALDYATRGSEEWLALKVKEAERLYETQKKFIEQNIRDEEEKKRLLTANEKELNDKIIAIKKDAAAQQQAIRDAEKAASIEAAQVVVGALASAFPQVKGFQVAMALLNLLSAAMKAAEAASGGGPGAAIAAYAAVFAALIGVISAMKSVSPGSSGTGGGRGGGGGRQRNNVVQFAPNATRDEHMSYYQQHRRSASSTTIVQNFNGTLVDSDQAMKKLNRELRRANRRDDERFIR